jgi:hypothetical protein
MTERGRSLPDGYLTHATPLLSQYRRLDKFRSSL